MGAFGWSAALAPLLLAGPLLLHTPPALGDELGVAPSPCGHIRSGQPLVIVPLLSPAPQPITHSPDDYRHRLRTTPLGWPLQSTWCVWVEPPEPTSPIPMTTQRWQKGVAKALEEWQTVLSIRLVADPALAQVVVWRRRPPLGRDGSGRARASHGRAILSLRRVGEGASGPLEPQVEVLISPGQRLEGIQATALHELGHAFGIWGHSDHPDDAMGTAPGAQPILQLSQRDRATVQWLYQQPTPMRSDP